MTVDTNIDAAEDLFGKVISDLQSGVSVGESAITGHLNYVSDYTRFSGDVALQSGNYLALHASVPDVEDVTITVKLTNTVTLDDDGQIVLRIADKDSQTVTVVASKEGYDSVTKVFSLSGLTVDNS